MARVMDLKIFGGHRFNSHSGHWVEMFLSQLQLSRTTVVLGMKMEVMLMKAIVH